MTETLRVGLAGLGVVGVGVIDILQKNREEIKQRCGKYLDITVIAARDSGKDRGVDLTSYRWASSVDEFYEEDDVDIVVEMIGGSDGFAYDVVAEGLKRGKHVVTSNKALMAERGYELAERADEQNVALFFEGAVAGGIPVIKTLREGLAANNISSVYGILNGTCNYILTEMQETGRDFDDVLMEAQNLGYAEADPHFDVDGIDAAHKTVLLGAIAFGIRPDMSHIMIRGIRQITALDFLYASELGYVIKLLGRTRMEEDGTIIQMVEPCLVPEGNTIAVVNGVLNAVSINGDYIGNTLSVGPGAGKEATASAVVADLVDIARGSRTPAFGRPAKQLKTIVEGSRDEIAYKFYLRLLVADKPGVFADIATIMRDHDVSMEAIIQRNDDTSGPVPIVMTTHHVQQYKMKHAIQLVADKLELEAEPVLFRIEDV